MNPMGDNDYAKRHLATHFRELKRWADLDMLLRLPSAGVVGRWVDTGDVVGVDCMTALIESGTLEPHEQAAWASQIARIHSHRAEYDEADRWLDFALEHSQGERGRRARAVALHERGSTLLYHRDLDGAAEHYTQALAICESGEPVYVDEAGANRVALSTVAAQRYDWEGSLRLAEEALACAREANDTPHALASRRMAAQSLLELDRLDEALGTIDTALAEANEAGHHTERARLLLLRAYGEYCEAALNNAPFDRGLNSAQMALEIATSTHGYHSMQRARLWVGRCAVAEGRLDEAQDAFGYLPTAVTDVHPQLGIGRIEGTATLAHAAGDLATAAQRYQEAAAAAQERDFRIAAARALCGLGAVQWHTGARPQGEETWRKASEQAENAGPLSVKVLHANLTRMRQDPTAPPR
jgi:tetratricopeptide (TPR) repeat protein